METYDPQERRAARLYNVPQFPMYSPVHTPGLRGMWSMTSIDGNDGVRDMSEQGRTLTNTNSVTFAVDNFMAYAEFNGSNQDLTRADEGGLSITGALTFGAWAYFDNTASSAENIMSKHLPTGNQRAYQLRRTATGEIEAIMSTDGSATKTATGVEVVGAATWVFTAMRFTPSTELAAFNAFDGGDSGQLNKATNTTSIPATIFDSTTAFFLGQRSGAANYMDGRIGLTFLCASALSDKILNLIYAQTRELLKV